MRGTTRFLASQAAASLQPCECLPPICRLLQVKLIYEVKQFVRVRLCAKAAEKYSLKNIVLTYHADVGYTTLLESSCRREILIVRRNQPKEIQL